jgi:hypothetical protein
LRIKAYPFIGREIPIIASGSRSRDVWPMAHELMTENGRAAMFSEDEKPWHGHRAWRWTPTR